MKYSSHSCELEQLILSRKRDFFHVNVNRIDCIIRNLKFVYHSIVASENLLSCAIRQLELYEPSTYRDEVLLYFVEHLDEEKGHADWLAEDLTTHGISITELENDAMTMVGGQYYMLYHKHPYCLLGYIAVLEGTPTPISEIEKLEQIYGKKLFRTARFHSIKDQEHKIELFKIIDKTPQLYMADITRSTNITLDCIENAAKRWI